MTWIDALLLTGFVCGMALLALANTSGPPGA
jgi:hypothetical protein